MSYLKVLGSVANLVAAVANSRRYRSAVRSLANSDAHGSARFLTPAEIVDEELTVTAIGQPNGLLLGGSDPEEGGEVVICYPGDRHLITFAPTRSGKGACHVVPNLLFYTGTAFIIDVKGENFLATQRRRRAFSQVHAFAPYDTRIPSSRINPMDFVRVGTVNEADDARTLAALLVEATGSDKDKFWEEYARTLLSGLILFMAHEGSATQRTISGVVKLLSMPVDKLEAIVLAMSGHHVGAVATTGATFASMSEDMFRNVLASLAPHLACWAPGGPLEALTAESDLSLETLRDQPTSFYLIIPPERIRENRSALRVLSGIAVRTLARSWPKPGDKPILFVLDEFANLGRMEDIEDGITYLAGSGIQIWMIVQDFSQLKSIYKEKADTIFSNCGARIFFSIQDLDTAKKVSEMIGNRSILIETPTKSGGGFLNPGTVSTSHSVTARPLLSPDELMRLDRRKQIIFLDEKRPISGQKWFYFERPEMLGLYDDPRPLLGAKSLSLPPRPSPPPGPVALATPATTSSAPPVSVSSPPSAASRQVVGRPARGLPSPQIPSPPASPGKVAGNSGQLKGRPPRVAPGKS